MPIMKKATPAPYMPPTMAETHLEYAERLDRLIALESALTDLVRERKSIERDLAEMPAPKVKPSVAALLGDEAVDERVALRARLHDVRNAIVDHESAIELQRRRVDESVGRASMAVCEAVKPEYGRRVAAVIENLKAAQAARVELRELANQLEADGVRWTRLGVFDPTFLGDYQDGHIDRLEREAREAGYVE